MEAQPFVRSVRRSDEGLEVAVADVEQDSPLLARHLAEAGIPTGEITPRDPSYDEIFVRIVTQHNETAGATS